MIFKRYALAWIFGSVGFLAAFGGYAQISGSVATRLAGGISLALLSGVIWGAIGFFLQVVMRYLLSRSR